MTLLEVLSVVVISYLLGSVPTAYLAARTQSIDIFSIGSGNMGATNVSRALGIRWGVAVMLFDMFKGGLAIFISQQILRDEKAIATTISAIAVIVGHNWSLFATMLTGTLRGGKGASTTFGTLVMIAPIQVVVAMLVIGALIVAKTRYVSLGVLIAFTFSTLSMTVLILQNQLDAILIIYTLVIAVLMMSRFRGNIRRLLDGTERRLGERV